MREFAFRAWCRSGKFCSGDTFVLVNLTDEEAERLLKYGTIPEIYYDGFSNCTELEDIYDRVYPIAVKQITEEMREWADEDDEEEAETMRNPNWSAEDSYDIGIGFPIELKKLFPKEE